MSALARRLSPLIGLALLLAAMWVLRRELQTLTFRELAASLSAFPRTALVVALALTALNYAIMTGYDQLAFVYLGRRFPPWQVAMVSFVGYTIANNVGFSLVSGATARYRFYSRWGLTAQEISRIVVFCSVTFWLGLLVLGGWSLMVSPPPGLRDVPGHEWARPIGTLLIVATLAYAVAPLVSRKPITLGRFQIPLPAPRLLAGQFALSTFDWALAIGVLWILLPTPRPPFAQMVSAFIAAQLLGLLSNLPGGVGVFETVMVLLLKGAVSTAALVPALVVFRIIYYLLPLMLALVILLIDELYERRHHLLRWGNAFGTLARSIAPQLLAVFTFLAGTVLLLSGATPAAAGRLAWLGDFLPLPIIEASHFIASLVGLGLLLVSRGLARRVDAAWVVATLGLATGVVASLLKGGGYEEALVLTAVLALLVPARGEFDRRAALFEESFSGRWFAAALAAVIASIWLGEFAFRHVQYSRELWWRFELDQDAPRFLRATVGVTIALLVVGLRQLLRPAPPDLVYPSNDDLEAAAPVIAAQTSAVQYLAYLRDKALLWNDDRTAFLMYSAQGRTWIALRDPVGPPDAARGLVRRFLEQVDDGGGIPVFYEVRKEWLHVYADYGLTFAKLGEEARVRLAGVSLAGSARKNLRTTLSRLERDGVTFRVIAAADVPPLVGALREVSDEWLKHKGVAEKGFSLGFFDPEYLTRLPIAVLERDGRVEAFASLWPGPQRVELSVDLMRYRPSAPPGSTDGLFAHLMLWGSQQGYEWFNLGMAPLSGLEASDVAPLWVKIASYLYEYGEQYSNFQGLRTYKEKFDPVWEPRYLAYPGGLALPRVLADVSALIAGGYRRIFLRRAPSKPRR